MTRFIGIDIRATHVRAVLLRRGYRKVIIDRMLEVDRAHVESLTRAVQACVTPLLQHGEPLCVAIEGERAFIHRLELPASARRQLGDVLPYEIEAQVPLELDELVYDHRELTRAGREGVHVLVAAARIETVRERIALVKGALGVEPDQVGCGPLALANLVALLPPGLAEGSVALVDLGGEATELVIVEGGEPALARTLSRGMQSLPAGAPALAAELRQTMGAYAARHGASVERVILVGGGAADPNATAYLGYMLGVPVVALADLGVELAEEAERPYLPRFAKAIGLALSLAGKTQDLDLRQGPLEHQRGFAFLKEKTPILSGLAVAIAISFTFQGWAESKSLAREHGVLSETLRLVSKQALGEEHEDPAEVLELMSGGGDRATADPMPHADAFDLLVELSKGIPMDLPHDLDEVDVRRGHVKLNGVVGTKTDVEKVEAMLKKWRCAREVKIAKITQVVNSNQQKYVLEMDLKCPEDDPKKKAKPAAAAPEASVEAGP